MNVLRLVCILLPFSAVSCQPPAGPRAATPQSNDKSDSKKGAITVTIDGREATPEEAEALGAVGKKLLSDAVHQALNKHVQELVKKLEINDPVENDLLSVAFGHEVSDGDALLSVHLIRPAKEATEPRTIVLSRDGKPIVRFTRASARVERPLAIMTLTFMKDGHLTQSETFLVHRDGKWKQYRPSERNENMN